MANPHTDSPLQSQEQRLSALRWTKSIAFDNFFYLILHGNGRAAGGQWLLAVGYRLTDPPFCPGAVGTAPETSI
jgi:hypothetical protein